MTYTCPEGHSSASGDYCDVCGSPIAGLSAPGGSGGGAGALPPPLPGPGLGSVPGPGPAGRVNPLDLSGPPPMPGSSSGSPSGAGPAELICPNCAAGNLPGALYCENCGYDFTTGQLPRPLDPPGGQPAAAPLPADLLPPSGAGLPAPAVDADPIADLTAAPVPAPGAGAASSPGAAPGLGTVPPVTPTSAPGPVERVAEVWVDPEWYASQDVSEPCPSAGMPLVVPIVDRTVLIGRLSTSRNIHPQIDLSSDNGVSRRHAQLNSDGQRWWVEDLQSANGTFVGAAGDPLPGVPIPVGQRAELADDDRIFVGAWTRVVVRRATPEEATLGA
jgi:FHA domain